MTRLRRAIILMVIFLAVFFNIERLDYSDQTVVDLQTFVYVLVSILILSTLFLSFLQKLSTQLTLALWLGVYLALKLTLFSSRPLIGGIYTYLSITEMAMIAIAALLTMNLTRSLNELEGIAVKTVFPKRNHRVKDLREAEEDIKTEFIRSRRHNRPLSVLIVEMDRLSIKKNDEQSSINVQQLMMNRFALASLGQVLTKVVRRTDVILEPEEQDGFILLCPETTAEGASLLANRIQTLAQKDLGLTVQCGTAAFPEEAIAFDDLLEKARGDMLEPGELSQVTISNPVVENKSNE
jgi:GGDEF domain-containing protein